jgi:hypothetical protein
MSDTGSSLGRMRLSLSPSVYLLTSTCILRTIDPMQFIKEKSEHID